MIRLAIAFALFVPAAPAATSGTASGARIVTSPLREVVTLEPEEGEHARWIELSGPSILLREGESEATELTLRPKVKGAYVFASLPREDASLGQAKLVELEVLPPVPSAGGPTAWVSGDLLVGAEEDVVLRAHILSGRGEVQSRTRWKQLSGPRIDIDRSRLAEAKLRLRPAAPGRYRFAVRLRGGAGRTPWATFTFEVPRRADGSADRRPLARVRTSGEAVVGGEVVLDGSASSDPDGDGLTYLWQKLSGPEGDLVGEGPRVRLFPASPGEYSFALTVGDPSGLGSRPEVVTLRVRAAPGPAAPDPDAPDPLDRPFSVLLKDAPLSALFSRLSDKGVTVRTAPDLGDPARVARRRIDLWVVDLPARRVLDWLGRMLRAFYVVEGPGTVWFSRDTKWLEREEAVAETYRIDALYSEEGASDLIGMLRESLRAVLWALPGLSVGEGDLDKGTLTMILPRSAHVRVFDLISELRRPVPSGPPPFDHQAQGALRELERAGSEEEVGFAGYVTKMLSRQVRGGYEGWSVRDAAWDLARQARVTIAFDSGSRQAQRRVRLPTGPVTLAEAVETLVLQAGFAGFVVEPPGAIWLYGQAEGKIGRPALVDLPPPLSTCQPPRTSQCMWQAAEVRSYDVRMLGLLHGFSGPMLVHLVKGRVFPDRWADPFVMVGYSAARERLVVIHHEEVQRAVAAFLDRMSTRGQEALEE